jgi:hypothetical protein
MSIARSTEKMFMLPVSEAEALNIVVNSPCWKYGWTGMLSFKYVSMAFRKSGKPGQDVCLILLGKNLLKRTLLCISFLSW